MAILLVVVVIVVFAILALLVALGDSRRHERMRKMEAVGMRGQANA
jgi:hypothetical protein